MSLPASEYEGLFGFQPSSRVTRLYATSTRDRVDSSPRRETRRPHPTLGDFSGKNYSLTMARRVVFFPLSYETSKGTEVLATLEQFDRMVFRGIEN